MRARQICMINPIYIWRKNSEINSSLLVCCAPRGKVDLIVWECICFSSIGTLTSVKGNTNVVKYISIIEHNVIFRHFQNDYYTFMDGVHRARAFSPYMENNNIHHTEWPAQSPDINPIENI